MTAGHAAEVRVHFVVHEAFEAPGAFDAWIASRGHVARYSRVYAGDALPRGTDGFDVLVVLGGPQSPTTTRAECPHFDAAAECALLAAAVADGKVVVGVCLGAQLLGVALGAPHERSPAVEIGNHAIVTTDEGRRDPVTAHLGAGLVVGHWHADMPGLTADARVLATGPSCPRQIVAYGPLAYGLQCHLELTPESVVALVAASEAELALHRGSSFVEPRGALLANRYEAMNEALFVLMDSLVARRRSLA